MPAKWSTLAGRETELLVYCLRVVKTVGKEPETTES